MMRHADDEEAEGDEHPGGDYAQNDVGAPFVEAVISSPVGDHNWKDAKSNDQQRQPARAERQGSGHRQVQSANAHKGNQGRPSSFTLFHKTRGWEGLDGPPRLI